MSERSVIGKIGCFADAEVEVPPLTPRGRMARAIAGLAFLAVAWAVVAFQLPGGVLSWLIAVVPAWFGVSHLVASVTGYQGYPEIGAIATLVLNRPIATNCDVWHRIDRVIGADRPNASACGCGCA